MKLSQCKKGEVVQVIPSNSGGLYDGLVGHIVGFKYNTFNKLAYGHNYTNEELLQKTIPVVRFPCGEESCFHQNNLRLYKD